MIHSWAPLIWLHSGEQFAPSSVDFFLSYVSLQNRKGRLIDNYLAPDRLPGGPDTAQLHLQTHDKLGTTKSRYLLLNLFHQSIQSGANRWCSMNQLEKKE